jgi:hypothetical protein
VTHRIEHVETGTWHRVIDDLEAAGFTVTYQYGGMDAGIDYSRFDLTSPDGGELLVFEWDNWAEGEIRAALSRLEVLRAKYRLAEPTEVE